METPENSLARSRNNSAVSSKGLKRRASVRAFADTTDPKKKREEDRAISLTHRDTRVKVERLFDETADGDALIEVEEFFHILAVIQEVQDNDSIIYNSGLITKFMDETMEYDALTKRGCLVVIGKFIQEARKHSERLHNETRADTTASSDVQLVDGWTYTKHVLTCGRSSRSKDAKDKKKKQNIKKLKWRGPTAIDPKNSLLLIVLVVAGFMTVLLIALLMGLNFEVVEDAVTETTRESLQVRSKSANILGGLVENSFIKAMDETGRALQRPLQNALDEIDEVQLGVLNESSIALATFARTELHRAEERDFIAMEYNYSVFEVLVLDLDYSMVQVHDLLKDNVHMVMYEAGVGVRHAAPSCATCKAVEELACVKRLKDLTAPMKRGFEANHLNGNPSLTLSGKITDTLGLCILVPTDLLGVHLIESLPHLLEGAMSVEGTHFRVYYRKLGSSAVNKIGNFTPISKEMDLLQNVSSDSTGVLHTFAHVLSTYAITTLIDSGLVFLVVSESEKNVFVTHVSSHIEYPGEEVAPVIAHLRTHKDIEVLGAKGSRDPASSSHLLSALEGVSGAMKSYDGDNREVIASYTSVVFRDEPIAIALERPIRSLATTVRSITKLFQDSVTHSEHRGSALFSRDQMGEFRPVAGAHSYGMGEENLEEVRALVQQCVKHRIYHIDIHCDTTSHGVHVCCQALPGTDDVLVTTESIEEVNLQLWLHVLYAVLVGIGLIVVCLIAIRLLTRKVLDHIEKDYVTYKKQIEEEKHQFSELVKDVMPSYIQQRIMAGEKLIVDQHPQLTFMFSDIVGFTEASRKLSTVEMVRLLGYMFMVEDGVAEHYGVHKIKTIGDAYFCVSGLEDAQRRKNKQLLLEQQDATSVISEEENAALDESKLPQNNQVYRMVAFASCVQLLLSNNFVHDPELTDCFRENAGGTDLPPFKMMSMRMGIHSGPAIAGVVDVGRAPHFDCFGPSVNLASRMESTAGVDRIQLSSVTYEFLTKLDSDQIFEFEAPKKTLVKGYGTVKTYTIKATSLSVPEAIIQRLHIARAVKRQHFGEMGVGHQELTDVESSMQSGSKRSSMSANEMGGSAKNVFGGHDTSSDNQQLPDLPAPNAMAPPAFNFESAPPPMLPSLFMSPPTL